MNKKVLSRILIWILVIGMILPLLVGLVSVYSVSQSELDALRKKKNQISAQRAVAQKELASIRNEMSTVLQRKEALDQKIALIAEEIDLTDEMIVKLDEEIAFQYTEIERLAIEEAELYEKFKKRLRVLYEEGNASYLEVLLGACDFCDLLDRIDKLGLVLEYDNNLMDSLKDVRQETERTTLALEANKEEVLALRQSLAQNHAEMEEDAKEAVALVESLMSKEAEQQGIISSLISMEKKTQADLNATAKALEEKRKKEEEARKKKEEEESKKKEQGGTTTPANPSSFVWPLNGYATITSYFGWRTHPITKQRNYHSGTDIAAPAGASIKAVADGKVIENTYNSIFGYYVRIDHGNGFVTLYGHMRKKSNVAVGSTVKKGSVIGGVGSTGLSTGNHLHISIYKNGTLVDPLKYIKP